MTTHAPTARLRLYISNAEKQAIKTGIAQRVIVNSRGEYHIADACRPMPCACESVAVVDSNGEHD